MKRLINLFVLVLLLTLVVEGNACTLYAAQGTVVQNGGALIAKVRDYKPEPQEIRVNKNGKYAFFGLYAGAEPEKMVVKAGVNEKGLVAVTATAGSIPAKQRRSYKSVPCLRKMLQNYTSVAEALADESLYLGPKYIMLADCNEIAYVEIGIDGETAVERQRNGVLTHTNFYLDPKFLDLNKRISSSASLRYVRINELLDNNEKLYTLADFIKFSDDRNAGPDNSIWRDGSTAEITQTLAAFIVELQEDNFKVWLKYRPNVTDKGNEKVVELTRDTIF